MESAKSESSTNTDADDFLREFFNFAQQRKDVAPAESKEVAVLSAGKELPSKKTSAVEITPASVGIFSLNLGVSDHVPVFNSEFTSLSSTELSDKTINANQEILSTLAAPVITTADALCSYLGQAKSDSDQALIPFYNEGQDDIAERVSAELEKVLNDPAAFEDIELYLECSEDDTDTINKDHDRENDFKIGNFSLHAGNSTMKSDVNLKISFPSIPDELGYIKRCSSCRLPFRSDQDLLMHLNSASCEVLLCRQCVYNTKSVKRFLTHMKTRHNISGIDKVLQNFTSSYRKVQGDSNLHSLINSQDASSYIAENVELHTEKLVEDIVNDVLPSADGACENKSSGKTGTSYPCAICKYVGKSLKLLRMHYQNIHCANRKLYKCQVCEFSCVQKRSFNNHIKSHEGSYPYSCCECERHFTTATALNRHKKIHRTERLHVCLICSKSFKIKSTLTDHIKRVHRKRVPIGTFQERNFCLTKKQPSKILERTFDGQSQDEFKTQNVGLCSGDVRSKHFCENESQTIETSEDNCINRSGVKPQSFSETESYTNETTEDSCVGLGCKQEGTLMT